MGKEDANKFAATLLRRSSIGFAGMAVGRAVEAAAEGDQAPSGFESWKARFQNLVMELAAAVEDGGEQQFAERVVWLRDSIENHGADAGLLGLGLNELEVVVKDSLPPTAELGTFFRTARESLAGTEGSTESAWADPLSERLGLVFLEKVRAGSGEEAMRALESAIEAQELDTWRVLDEVLVGVLREIGRLWHGGMLGIGEEHYASQVTGRFIERLLSKASPAPSNGHTVLLAMAEGDDHDLGLRIVAGLFELRGWTAMSLGSNTPSADLAAMVGKTEPDVVVLGATLNTHRDAVAAAIQDIRGLRPGQPILVGGAAFQGLKSRAHALGADGCVNAAGDAPQMALDLLAS